MLPVLAVLGAGVFVPAVYACAVYGFDVVSVSLGREVVAVAAYAVLLVASAVLLRGLLIEDGGHGAGRGAGRFAAGAVAVGITVPVLVNVLFLLGGDPAARDVAALDGYLVVSAIAALGMAVVLAVRLRIAVARAIHPG